MKVLSILQPWASLIVMGPKRIETRSWATKYRGPLLIHASARWSGKQNSICCDYRGDNVFYPALTAAGFTGGRSGHKCGLPLGSIIGQVNLVDVVPTSHILHNMDLEKSAARASVHEEAFGDYSPGRYGWLLSDPIIFDKPIPAKGRLGLWEYAGEIPSK